MLELIATLIAQETGQPSLDDLVFNASCEAVFDVDPEGATRNIEVSCDVFPANPEDPALEQISEEAFEERRDEEASNFESVSSESIAKWRYESRLVNGEAVWRRGVETVLDFEMDEQE